MLQRQEFRIAPEEGVFSEAEHLSSHLELCRIKGLEGYRLLLWPINQVQETGYEARNSWPKGFLSFQRGLLLSTAGAGGRECPRVILLLAFTGNHTLSVL